MKLNKRIVLVFIVVILLIVAGIVAFTLTRNHSKPVAKQSQCSTLTDKSDFEQKINQLNDPKSGLHYTVTSVVNPAKCWYVVTGLLQKGVDPTKTVFQQSPTDNSLTIVTGPGTSLSSQALDTANAPYVVKWQVLTTNGFGNGD